MTHLSIQNILSQVPIGDFNPTTHILKKYFRYIYILSAKVRERNYLEVKLLLLQRKCFFANKSSADWIKTTITFTGKEAHICSIVKKKLEKLFISSCSNSNLLNTLITHWDFTNDIKVIHSSHQIFIWTATIRHATLPNSEVIIENKTNPHSHGTFILMMK